MTHDKFASVLRRAAGLTTRSPTPDAEIDDNVANKAVKAVSKAVEPVVDAIMAAEAAKAPVRDDTEVMPPVEFESKASPVAEPADEGDEPAWRANDASFRAKRFLMMIGMILSKDRSKLVQIRMLANEGTPARNRIDADWDAGLVSDAIEAVKAGNTFTHPDGWHVYPNKAKLVKMRKAS